MIAHLAHFRISGKSLSLFASARATSNGLLLASKHAFRSSWPPDMYIFLNPPQQIGLHDVCGKFRGSGGADYDAQSPIVHQLTPDIGVVVTVR